MSSYIQGKPETMRWIRANFPKEATVLDVGACDGLWRRLLPEYQNMDAVEAFEPNVNRLGIEGYRTIYSGDVRDFRFEWYDLIIFGDVIEHLSAEDAQRVLAYAAPRCRDMVVAVPWLFEQGAIYGNPYEVHIQDDLTPEIFAERYPGLELLFDTGVDYCYYHKKGGPT